MARVYVFESIDDQVLGRATLSPELQTDHHLDGYRVEVIAPRRAASSATLRG
jgi:hypothetical protein